MINRERLCRLALVTALGTFLYFVYLLTFSGISKSGDELFIIDTTDSFAVRSGPDRLLLNQTVYLRGLQTTDVEPAQPILAVPLYWTAYQIPWIGNIHALYLFNLFVVVITAAVLFYYALGLGYSERTAVIVMLLFGLTTIVWPYTKTFFREPVTMLSLFATTYFMFRWRQAFMLHWRRSEWLWFGLTVTALVIAVLSKEAILIALPVLVFFAVPDWSTLTQRRREMMIIGIVLAVLAVALAVALLIFRNEFEALTARYTFVARIAEFEHNLPRAWYPMLGYLFSPGRGIFWYSPVLVLAVGAPLILPANRWRESWLPLIMTLAFTLVYGAVRRTMWHGGLGWGPRYMVPLIPLLMIGTLPILDRVLQSPRRLPKLLLIALAGAGLLIQLGAGYVNLLDYNSYQEAATGLVPWNDAILWSAGWSQAIGTLRYLPEATADILWMISETDLIAITAIAAGMAAAGWLAISLHRAARVKALLAAALTLPLLAAAITLFVLARAYDDPRFEGHNQDLHALRATLAEQAGPDDIILLATPHYVMHFMNYYKAEPIWYGLPLSPGERYSCEQVPEVVSGDLREMIHPVTHGMLGRYSLHPISIWLVIDNGPSVPCATRPVEHLAAQTLYPVQAIDYTGLVRLVQFLPFELPATMEPASEVELRFGDSILLHGYDFAFEINESQFDLEPGDEFGVSLVWEATQPIDKDYTFAVYLIGPDGRIVLQQDRAPVGGFAPTTTWQPGERLRDNYGFVLPNTLPPGEYQIWAAIYSWPTLERLTVTDRDGTRPGDHTVLGTLEVQR